MGGAFICNSEKVSPNKSHTHWDFTRGSTAVGVISYFNFSFGIFEEYMLSDKSLSRVKVKRRFFSLIFVAI